MTKKYVDNKTWSHKCRCSEYTALSPHFNAETVPGDIKPCKPLSDLALTNRGQAHQGITFAHLTI